VQAIKLREYTKTEFRALLALLFLQLADYFLTMSIISDLSDEVNPVARWLIGREMLLWTKLSVVAGLGLLVAMTPKLRRGLLLLLWTAVWTYTAIVLFMLLQIGLIVLLT